MTGRSNSKTSAADDASSDVAVLREELNGKNELIAALVAELEQVAEQLDRVKRSGADRSRSATMNAGLPAEVVEEHQQVLGDLQRVVQQWEQMQAAATLTRIEAELGELRSLVAGGHLRIEPNDADSSRSPTNLEDVLARLSGEAADESRTEGEPSGSAWEAMKRQGLDAEDAAGADTDDDLTRLLDGLTAPVPVDFDTASQETLERACAERDTYIVQITRWVRTRRSVKVPDNWDDLPGVSEELQQRVEQLASRLEEQVRLAEVEMSLERARLSREKSQLQADRGVMDKHLKRLGINSLDELEDIAVSSSSSGDRRWMRFLGVNRKS